MELERDKQEVSHRISNPTWEDYQRAWAKQRAFDKRKERRGAIVGCICVLGWLWMYCSAVHSNQVKAEQREAEEAEYWKAHPEEEAKIEAMVAEIIAKHPAEDILREKD